MVILIVIVVFRMILGCILLLRTTKERKELGILVGERIYVDTEENPGKLLYAKTIPLIGKPDFLRREKEIIFPIEHKSGRAPRTPYLNHVMQLMAYCYLVEEYYGMRPPGGYI